MEEQRAPLYPIYYDCRKQLAEHYKRLGRSMGLKSSGPAAVKAWQKKARLKFADLLGLERMKAVPPRARMTDSADCGDITREHWFAQVEREVILPFYLLRPKGVKGPLPAVICPHGHSSGGKVSPAGVAITPEVGRAVAEYNYDYGVQFARAGFLAFCPDARGFGQRQEKETRVSAPLHGSCHQLQLMGAPLGIPVIGMWTFDLMRLVDYAVSRKDVRRGKVGCAGLSGGGWQALALAAADTRVAAAVVSGYFYGVKESLLEMPGNCDCNLVPHLWEHFDLGDLGAMIAPRPLLIETGDEDGLNGAGGMKNVLPQMAIARQAYRGHGQAERLGHDVFHGGHRWNGQMAIPWMKQWLA